MKSSGLIQATASDGVDLPDSNHFARKQAGIRTRKERSGIFHSVKQALRRLTQTIIYLVFNPGGALLATPAEDAVQHKRGMGDCEAANDAVGLCRGLAAFIEWRRCIVCNVRWRTWRWQKEKELKMICTGADKGKTK